MNDQINDSLRRDMAFEYWNDARELREIFNLAWAENERFAKTGRIKILLNLLMACECALKAHVILSHTQNDPRTIYAEVRKAGHKIEKLCQLASYMQDRSTYDAIIDLGVGGVEVRYSLNATHSFFRSDDTFDLYAKTMANSSWVNQLHSHLSVLIDACQDALTGEVKEDWEAWFDKEDALVDLLQRKKEAIAPQAD